MCFVATLSVSLSFAHYSTRSYSCNKLLVYDRTVWYHGREHVSLERAVLLHTCRDSIVLSFSPTTIRVNNSPSPSHYDYLLSLAVLVINLSRLLFTMMVQY